jgi:hypothetical protein
MPGPSESLQQNKMAPYITPVRVEKLQNRAHGERLWFTINHPKEDFSATSPVSNEVVLEGEFSEVRWNEKRASAGAPAF